MASAILPIVGDYMNDEGGVVVNIGDYSKLQNPFSRVTMLPILTGVSYALLCYILRKGEEISVPIEVNLDGYPDRQIGTSAFLRIGTQGGGGCTFRCGPCSARGQAITLTTEEIVSQVVIALTSSALDVSKLERLTIATFGIGEPLSNPNLVQALQLLHALLPDARFIVSTSGPKSGQKIFAQLVELAKDGWLDFQMSIHHLCPQDRIVFLGRTADRFDETRPAGSFTLGELSTMARCWQEACGRKVVVNLGIGAGFGPSWTDWDYAELFRLFPPTAAIAKLSLEAVSAGCVWKPDVDELARREEWLIAMGYEVQTYIPEGIDQGAGCGALVELSGLGSRQT